MHHLVRGGAAVEDAGVGIFDDDHAARLDARVGGIDGDGGEVGEAHVGDEPGALVDVEHGFLAFLPLGDLHLAAEQAGLDADVRQRLGEGERAAPDLAVVTRLRRHALAHVVVALLLGAALVDGREREVAGEGAGGGAGVDPGELVAQEREDEVLRALDEAALVRVHERGGDAGGVVGGEELVFLGRPLVGVARALGDELRHDAAGDAAGGLHEHLDVEAVAEAPHDLAHVVTGQGLEGGAGLGSVLGVHERSGIGFRAGRGVGGARKGDV